MIVEQNKPKRRWLAAAGLLSFLIVAGFSATFEVQAGKLKTNISELQSRKEGLMKPAASEEKTAGGAIFAKSQLQKIQANQIPWSKIIEKMETLVPKTQDTNEPLVTLKSYTGNAEGKISVAGVTRADSPDSFADIASVIRAFEGESAFHGVFVPSVARSITPAGDSILTFSLTLSYKKPAL